MSYRRAWERVVLGAVLALSFFDLDGESAGKAGRDRPASNDACRVRNTGQRPLLLRQSMTTLTGIL